MQEVEGQDTSRCTKGTLPPNHCRSYTLSWVGYFSHVFGESASQMLGCIPSEVEPELPLLWCIASRQEASQLRNNPQHTAKSIRSMKVCTTNRGYL